MADFKYSAGIDVNLNVKSASNQLQELQKQLAQISNMKIDVGTGNLTADIEKASQAAMKLSAHLATATNPKTGNLDFTKFYTSIQKSGASLQEYGEALQKMGPAGQKAFVNLADSISKSEIPLKRTSQMVDKMWDGLKRTASWQLQSSIIHGVIGSIQSAVGYAKDLNSSLNDIRIVTGQSTEQMAKFAKQANQAAKSLSTTTTDYTKASLIYYQQGLSDEEVKQRAEATVKMANVSGQSAEKVSSQMTAIWNNYDNGSKSLEYYGDVITALGAKTASSSEEIAQGIQKFAAVSDTIGLSYEYAASALATVTATTRESADVVGNAYKTLFSRIQGLNLGETLDDGTTLNKYSTALAKVGISIKDSSGNLKNMDSILNEMGSKWETLSKDQQTALAQTVAGVRQYTQLVALMDNWDYFQQNLQIAKTSSGTLDQQAAIFAESWEAASDRVRASWEGLWDNLINSDGFITILNGLSSIVNVLDGMVSGLGGAGGALLTFGGILTKVFNSQITSTISNAIYSIGMLFPKNQQKMIDQRNSIIEEAKNILGKDQESTFGREAEYAARREGMSKQMESSLLYAQNKDKLSPQQQLLDDMYQKAADESYKAMVTASKNYDIAKEFRADFHGKFYDKNMANNLLSKNSVILKQEKLAELDDIIASRTNKMSKSKGQTKKLLKYELKKLNEQRAELVKSEDAPLSSSIFNRDIVFGTQEDYLQNQNKNNHNQIIAKLQEQRKIRNQYDAKTFSENAEKGTALYQDQQRYKQLSNEIITLRKSNVEAKAKLNKPQTFSEALMAQGQATAKFNQALTKMQPQDAESFIKSLNEFTHTASNSMGSNKFMQNAIKMAEEFQKTGDKEAFAVNFSNIQGDIATFMQQSMDSVTGAIYDSFSGSEDFIGKGLSKEEFMKQAAQAYRGTSEADIKMQNALNNYAKQMDARNANLQKTEKLQSGTEKVITGARGAMQALAAGESIKSLVTSIQDGSVTFTSALTGVTSAIMQGAYGFQGLTSALTGLGGLGAGAASGIALAATALLMLASTATEFWDQTHTNTEEMQQNLVNSSNELANVANTAKDTADTSKSANEAYLEGIDKIKSFAQDPTSLAEDIYESNKRALELINEYDLSKGVGGYSIAENGLIEINKEVLDKQQQLREDNAISTDYANIIGQAVNKAKLASITTETEDNELDKTIQDLKVNRSKWMPDKQELIDAYRGGPEAWEALKQSYELDNLNLFAQTWHKTTLRQTDLSNQQWQDLFDSLEKTVGQGEENLANAQLDTAAMSTAAKILSDRNITAESQEAYSAYQKIAADYVKEQFLNPANQLVNTTKNTIKDEEALTKLLASQGQKGAGQFRMDSGVVYYKLEGESEERHFTGETLNALYAATKVNPTDMIKAADDAWADVSSRFQGKMAEAAFFKEQFGTVSGASMDSAIALANANLNSEGWTKDWKESAEYQSIIDSQNALEILGLYKNSQSVDEEATGALSLGTMQSLMNSMAAVGDADLTEFSKLMPALTDLGKLQGEDLAGALTAIANLDFQDSSYSNLQNIAQILNSFGADIDLTDLIHLQEILNNLGAGTAENLKETNVELTKGTALLSGLSEKVSVDEATANELQKYFGGQYFVKNENGEYTFTGSQDMIDEARSNQHKAFAESQAAIDQAQSNYAATGGNLQTYDNYEDFQTAYAAEGENGPLHQLMGGTAVETSIADAEAVGKASWWDKIFNPEKAAAIEEAQDSALKAVNNQIENGTLTDEAQSQMAADYMADITSAQDIMNAVNEAQKRGDTAGFLDANGVISDEALARLNSLPATSERAANALDTLTAAQDAYQEGRASLEEVSEAQYNYDLQQSIDAVAAARGLDADVVAQKVEIIKEMTTAEGEYIDQAGNIIKVSEMSAKALALIATELIEQDNAIDDLKSNYKSWAKQLNELKKGSSEWNKVMVSLKKTLGKALNLKDYSKLSNSFIEAAQSAGLLEKAANGDINALDQIREQSLKVQKAMEKGIVEESDLDGKSFEEIGNIIDSAFANGPEDLQQWANDFNSIMETIKQFDVGELITGDADFTKKTMGILDSMGAFSGNLSDLIDACAKLGITPEIVGPFSSESEATMAGFEGSQIFQGDPEKTYTVTNSVGDASTTVSGEGNYFGVRFTKNGGGGSGGSGGGGGGGGPKEPKKVANKPKSKTVKRYKRIDTKRDSTEKYKKSEENKKDYLYGESKIAQMEKINKLAEKEAKITADRIKESRTYLIEDRENLIKYLQKYGYEAEFDADGFLTNYEKVWTDVYEQIAALYEDNELTEEESKIEEDLNIMLEELEGALEDYENSLSELQDDIEAYEETLYEMYDNKVEALEHKVEFKIELSEDDLDYLDFWIESLGDNIYNALEAIEAMGAKANALFDGLETYQQGIIDIMSLSDDPLQVWATGGIEGILTQAQVDALRENRDGLADYMQQLIDLRDEIKDKVLDTFDDWQEKLDSTLITIEHYTSVLEHFRNMIDVVGKDSLGLSNQFMANLEQNAINQSLDSIDANKAYYDNLVEIQQEAQEKLEEARARGDQSSADRWEEIVKSTTEAMQDAQDALLTSLEDSLNLIAEQFETNIERAVEAFNDAIYAYDGLEGLSNDYSLIRENADLMAADYEKIYELSKITRNINKTLDDTNIIAGKQKLISLQKEINNLQNSGVELSKYDLEYLQAKYELRLAEIELENAQNAKDTVRLSRDSEGNWSYIYTQNADAVEEAGQKYEDALYEMQKLSQEYLEEMSSSMLDTSSAMMEEISGLRIQDFNSYEEYQAEIKRIQDKYAESLKLQEAELNKAVSNSQQIYEQDWRNYNLITGYKISESEKWVDAFKESTIGQLLNSDTIISSFSDTFLGLTEILTKNLADSAVSYFTNIDKAFATYGTSIEDFGKHVEDSTKKISDKSKEAAGDAKKMASEMNDAFKEIADTVSSWQEQFSSEIDKMLEKIKTLIQDINEAIETSANLQSDNRNSSELIGQDEAIDLLNEQKLWGTWGRSENGALTLNGNATTFTDFNGELIQEIDDKMTKMFNAKTGSEERSKLEEEVKELFKQYWLFKDIVGRVYDVTDLQAPTYASLDTGGYTGEWGDSGKFAMLHEKELVLNKDDTKNFLDALNLSKDIINSMIEMNAKQSSLALGNLAPTSIQDMSQVLEQSVTIQAEFPNATDHSEIEEAFNNLINTASQYANRRK